MSLAKSYLTLIKFSHTIFAMPFALIGFFLGCNSLGGASRLFLEGQPLPGSTFFSSNRPSIWWILVCVLLCMAFARSAAMAFNRYLDRKYDAKNPRTAQREIPSGVISPRNALIFTIGNSIAFILVAAFINKLCFYLSPVALAVILGYSYTKRFTALCHLVLGLGLSLAPVAAYIAVTDSFDVLPILFSLIVLFWVSGFDIIYALQDVEFDRSQQLYSIPAVLGRKKGLLVSRLFHFFAAILVALCGWYGDFGIWYWAGALIFCGMLVYQHSIVRSNDLRRVNVAFMTSNGIASVIFAIFVIADIFY